MKFFNVLSFFIVVCFFEDVYSGECSPEEEGFSKRLECNRCICRRGHWLCTKRGCLSNFSKRELPIAADLKNIPCAPNDYFQIDCNTCYCNLEQSGYLCTENLCSGDELMVSGPTTQIPLANSSILLIANNTAQIINNSSDIEDNSTFILPKIDVSKLRDPTRRHPKIFRPASTSPVVANSNAFLSNSTSDLKNSTRSSASFSCTPGQVFKKDCNDCTCTQDGKNAICTLRKCDAESEILVSSNPVSKLLESSSTAQTPSSIPTSATTPTTQRPTSTASSVSSTSQTTQLSGKTPSAAIL